MKMGRIGKCLKDEKRGIWGSFSRMFDVRSHKEEFEICVEYKNTITFRNLNRAFLCCEF
jgi:hypothetical protein